jgi:hypothetical protein
VKLSDKYFKMAELTRNTREEGRREGKSRRERVLPAFLGKYRGCRRLRACTLLRTNEAYVYLVVTRQLREREKESIYESQEW